MGLYCIVYQKIMLFNLQNTKDVILKNAIIQQELFFCDFVHIMKVNGVQI